jgi:23S rRNA pseudouridine1911/1915/1917 synthase
LSTAAPQVLYVDNHLLVLRKPAGMPVQPDESGDLSLLDWGKAWLKKEYAKPGNVFLGLVHRLDRPVAGVVVFGRTSKGAARLSEQFRTRAVKKIYWALAEGEVPAEGVLRHEIVRPEGKSSQIAAPGEGKPAELSYRRLGGGAGISRVEIELGTGRHHQIRLQFSASGHPLLGDKRYGSTKAFGGQIALLARELVFKHPTRNEQMRFVAEPDESWNNFMA